MIASMLKYESELGSHNAVGWQFIVPLLDILASVKYNLLDENINLGGKTEAFREIDEKPFDHHVRQSVK